MGEGAGGRPADALQELIALDALGRIWGHDASLWTVDPGKQTLCTNRLGWLRSPSVFLRRVDEMAAPATDLREEGMGHVVLCGMGGSSLGAQMLVDVLQPPGPLPELIVLDTTDPRTLRAVDDRIDLEQTVFVIASKSGSTLETDCLRRHFTERARAVLGGAWAGRFVAITDPGSELACTAAEQGYRAVFENPPDVGGRYAVLSFFGLVPAVLCGVDVVPLLESAHEEAEKCRLWADGETEPPAALRLAAAMGGRARSGVDKMAVDCRERSFGDWVEQLVAESTGKRGRGILPDVTGVSPDGPGRFRVRVEIDPCGAPEVGDSSPRVVVTAGPLGALIFRFEMATVLASVLLGVEPFAQPDVDASKRAAGQILDGGGDPGPAFVDEPAPAILAALAAAPENGYLAILSYLPRSDGTGRRLSELAGSLASRIGTVTLGHGPRYLHSTGQLHKGGPATGVFLFLQAPTPGESDLPVPGRQFTFGGLNAAQAEGDARSLVALGRPVIRVRLQSPIEDSLGALRDTFPSV